MEAAALQHLGTKKGGHGSNLEHARWRLCFCVPPQNRLLVAVFLYDLNPHILEDLEPNRATITLQASSSAN